MAGMFNCYVQVEQDEIGFAPQKVDRSRQAPQGPRMRLGRFVANAAVPAWSTGVRRAEFGCVGMARFPRAAGLQAASLYIQ